jgi:uncharacterized membrane protein
MKMKNFNTSNMNQSDNDGCALLGCLAAPFLLLSTLLMYLVIYGTMIAVVILTVMTVLEWAGMDVPNFHAPDWFGQEGIGD